MLFFCLSFHKYQSHLNKGDVALTAAHFFSSSPRVQAAQKPSLTLAQVDAFLEQLSKTGREAEQEAVLGRLLRVATPAWLRWFIRLVCHDLRMGAQAKHVLGALGPKVYDAYQSRQVRCFCMLARERGRDRKHQS